MQEIITPVEVHIESETDKVELGPASREALRVEQVQDLHDALEVVVALTEPLDSLNSLDSLNRAQLEDLGRHLAFAQRASSALWWLIPADVYTDEDEDE
jgi:hypothetical protein